MSGVLHRYERSAAAAVPRFYTIVSVFSNEGPPVPIPNTEVKLICADDTWREAAWENRSMLTRLPCRGGGFPSCLLCRTVLYSSLAQSVEHAAVNRGVVGSSPTGGARKKPVNTAFAGFSYFFSVPLKRQNSSLACKIERVSDNRKISIQSTEYDCLSFV